MWACPPAAAPGTAGSSLAETFLKSGCEPLLFCGFMNILGGDCGAREEEMHREGEWEEIGFFFACVQFPVHKSLL